MYILAIDLGTQSIKTAIVDLKGVISTVSQEHQDVDSPYNGWAQQKPELWWELTHKAIVDVVKKSGINPNAIKGICACGQMHGPVGIGQNGEITTDWTQIWMDKRCEDICDNLRKNNDESELANITGNPITTGWVGVKVRWIKENQPEIYKNTKWFLAPKDFINFQLTGTASTDYSEASGTYLFDFNKGDYSTYMAKNLGIDLDKFAPIHNSYDIIGHIKPNLAKELGIPINTPVLAGGGDFLVSLLGLGMIGEKNAVDMTGTSTLLVVHKNEPLVHPAIQNLRHVIEGWTPFTMLDCGGLAMKWCMDLLSSIGLGNVSYDRMIEMAEKIVMGSEGLMFYPYLLGERRQDNVFAKGCFYGLTLNHEAGHIARSIMEGVALALGKDMQIFRNLGVQVEKVYCVGGATRNKLLYKIKADITQIPHVITDEPEASLRGCGLLAAYGLQVIQNFINEEINKDEKDLELIEPNKNMAQESKTLQQRFNKMYDHLIGYWR